MDTDPAIQLTRLFEKRERAVLHLSNPGMEQMAKKLLARLNEEIHEVLNGTGVSDG